MTNGKCFAELPASELPVLRTWNDGDWLEVDLSVATRDEVAALLLAAWRQRASRREVAGLDYARGRDELSDVFAELRTWPELTERGEGDFAAAGRAFLHFHHYEQSRHADVKDGLDWGEAIPFPLGRPSSDVAEAFYAEVRRRLSTTIDAVAARKAGTAR